MPETKRRPGPAPRISRDAILDVARRLPPAQLTLAAVSAELGVTGPALYRYFPDRSAILEALAQEAREQLVPPDPDLPWEQWLQAAARVERALWKAHPNLREAANHRAVSRPSVRMLHTGIQVLTAAGFAPVDAYAGLTTVMELAHGIGWAESQTEHLFDPHDLEELVPLLEGIGPLTTDIVLERSLAITIEGLRSLLPAVRASRKPRPVRR
jgi:AcrR family transcriptional regulator